MHFSYEYAGEENGCYRLRFRPNPDYPAHSIEARIFHAMSGELWVSIPVTKGWFASTATSMKM